jgi:hypothetical protein
MNPYIEVKDKAINCNTNYNSSESNADSNSLYHVFISERNLKLLFTVEWVDQKSNPFEFQVVTCNQLYLDGIDNNMVYPITSGVASGTISSDTTIVNNLFTDNLNPYGIVINKLTFHNFKNFESVDFTFTDDIKRQKLYNLIKNKCKKIIERQ